MHRYRGQRESVCWAWLAELSRETVASIDLAKTKTHLLGVLPEPLVLESELPLRECLLCVRLGLCWGFKWLLHFYFMTPWSLEAGFLIFILQERELRLREVQQFAQSLTAREGSSQH